MVEQQSNVKLEDSILLTIKKLLSIDPSVTVFDPEIIVFINSALMTLNQLGIGPEEGFTVVDASDTWDDFTSALQLLSALQTYVYIFVRLIFDPPETSYARESLKKIQEEQLWRLNVQTETERLNDE